MYKQIVFTILALVLMCAFSTAAFAQAETKATKEGHTGTTAKTEMKGLYSVTCDPMCGFKVTSHDQAELTDIVKMHAKRHHNKDVTEAEVKSMMKPVSEKGSHEKMKEEKKPEGM